MSTRHVTYQFDWGFATYDRNTEQEAIDGVEAKAEYVAKFDVTNDEAAQIQDGASIAVEGDAVIVYQEGELL